MTAPAPPRRNRSVVRRMARWADTRLGAASFARTALRKVFPDHWSFMLGELALYSFVVLLATGVYLTFFFEPSQAETIYQGSYVPLQGVHMTEAYRSALDLSFDVRAGLVMRQMHHWAALVFVAAITIHLARVFFTGAFRRPREVNWVIGMFLLILAMFNGFAGYSMIDDQLSGTGLRIAYSVALSIPIIGTWVVSLLFGGAFPGPDIIYRLYVLHILLLPALIAMLLTVHLALVMRHKHTQFRTPKAREDNVIGEMLWPAYAGKALGLFFIVAAVIAALGGLAQINPIWIYGPFDPAEVSAASQPDWYMGWLDGALRLMPGWEIRAFGYEIPNPFYPGVLMPGIAFGIMFAWPFLEARFTRDYAAHHILDRPRDRPVRTAIGVGGIVFYLVLFIAGGSDVFSTTFLFSVNVMFWIFRVLLFVAPVVAGLVTYRLCKDLTARERHVQTERDTPPASPKPPVARPQYEP